MKRDLLLALGVVLGSAASAIVILVVERYLDRFR